MTRVHVVHQRLALAEQGKYYTYCSGMYPTLHAGCRGGLIWSTPRAIYTAKSYGIGVPKIQNSTTGLHSTHGYSSTTAMCVKPSASAVCCVKPSNIHSKVIQYGISVPKIQNSTTVQVCNPLTATTYC
ncbi:unnamed protein product, partial [Pylaiella littoralis]